MQLKNLFGMVFGRHPPIREVGQLADFVDENSAFIMQKGIYEYSRARAGHYSKVLFREQNFLDAVDTARWRAYPLGLAMMGEMVEGTLRPADRERQPAVASGVARLCLSVFDRYPTPAPLDLEIWQASRADLALRLDRVSLHPPKPVMDIPEPLARAYFDLMPIHKTLRGSDFGTMASYLRIALCNIHSEMIDRMDAEAIRSELVATA